MARRGRTRTVIAAPPQLLPALLDAARGRTDLRPAALAFAGPRALWLARLNPDWRFALRSTPGGGAALPGIEEPETDPAGSGRRACSPNASPCSAAYARGSPPPPGSCWPTTWPTERAEDRLMFLDSLRAGLHAEPTSRSWSRRWPTAAATSGPRRPSCCPRCPDSALAARMAVRAAACVALDHTNALRPGRYEARAALAVEAPHECDAGMQRDGVVAKAAGRAR